MSPEISQETLAELKAGNIKAYEQMLFLFAKPIFGYIYSLVHDKDDAEDITQEVFIKVYKNLHTIEPEKNFKNWLYKIATNTFYDWCRAKKRRLEVAIDEQDLDFETNATDEAYLTIEGLDDNFDLELALKNIKPIYQTVLMLYYYQGFSYEEISDSLNLPLNTVKTYLRRAKIDLRAAIKKYE
jgi:RNA polymerase sigma-70 factor, ECF subfamily